MFDTDRSRRASVALLPVLGLLCAAPLEANAQSRVPVLPTPQAAAAPRPGLRTGPTNASPCILYTDRQSFRDANPGCLVLEDYSGTSVPSQTRAICDPPFNAATDNTCFAPGAIRPGVSMTVFGGTGGQAQVENNLPGGCVSIGALPHTFNNRFEFDPPVVAAGFDVFAWLGAVHTVGIAVYDASGNPLCATNVSVGATAQFFGAKDPVGIGSIEIFGDNATSELFCNVEFGGKVEPVFGVPCCLRPLSSVSIDDTYLPASIELFKDTALISFFGTGRQTSADVSDPQSMIGCTLLAFDPPSGDQWNEAHYIEGYDMLVTGHRAGGLNLLDTSAISPTSCASSFFTVLDSVSTNYHFSGLASWIDDHDPCAIDGPYVFYGEHPAGGNPGGLLVYDVSSGSLVPAGQDIVATRDGGDVAVTSDGNWVFQYLPNGDYTGATSQLIAYDVSVKSNPLSSPMYDLPGSSFAHDVDIELSEDDQYVFVGAREDGLQVVDVSDPLAPVFCASLSIPGYDVVHGISKYNEEILAVLAKHPTGGAASLSLVNVSCPCAPRIICTQRISPLTKEIDVHEGVVYILRRASTSAGTVLEAWI